MKKRNGTLVPAALLSLTLTLMAFLMVMALSACEGSFVDPGYAGISGGGGWDFGDDGGWDFGGNGDGGSGGGGGIPSTNGRLTINGLDDYNGQYVYASATLDYSWGSSSMDADTLWIADSLSGNAAAPSIYLGTVSGGSVTLKVWAFSFDIDLNNPTAAGYRINGYSGNDTVDGYSLSIMISNKRTLSSTEMQEMEYSSIFGEKPAWLVAVGFADDDVTFRNGVATCTAYAMSY